MKTAMILAAGRGERLRPLTDYTPKAMLPVDGMPLIERHVRRLALAGFKRIVINHAYLGGQIRQHLGDGTCFGTSIVYSPEPPGGLETGGGLFQALPLLGDAPFLAVNADIDTDFDFTKLALNTAHTTLVLTACLPNTRPDFGLVDNKVVNHPRTLRYTGIAVYHPVFFKGCVFGRYSVAPLLRDAADKGLIDGIMFQGHWRDIGV